MGRLILQIAASLVGVAALLFGAFVLGFRSRRAGFLGRIRRFNRDVTNRRVLRTAGEPGAPASVVNHVGRRSGRDYRTPVGAVPTDDGFAITLPYGPDTDWVRNVLAAGTAVIDHEGRQVTVAGPRVVGTDEAADLFGARERWLWRVYGVREVLLLDVADQTVA